MGSRVVLGITFVAFAAVLGTAYSTLAQNQPAKATAASIATTTAPATASTKVATAAGYTMSTVAKHHNASSCWTAINGNVYDLTNWINQHPGGKAPILSLCGTDGSAAFNGKHGTQARPASELKNFLLGALAS